MLEMSKWVLVLWKEESIMHIIKCANFKQVKRKPKIWSENLRFCAHDKTILKIKESEFAEVKAIVVNCFMILLTCVEKIKAIRLSRKFVVETTNRKKSLIFAL